MATGHGSHTQRVGARRWLAVLGLALLAGPAAAIQGGSATTGFASVGTGVQVTADWVFTARHTGLTVNGSFTNGYGSRTVAARYDVPSADGFPANDFTLLRLVAAPTSAPLLPVLSLLPADGGFAPVDVTFTSASADGLSRSFAHGHVDAFQTLLDPDDAGPQPPVTVNYLLSLDPGVYLQGGDSGRGLFFGQVADTGSQSGVLWGINSAQLGAPGGGPIGSAFVLPAAYRSWIDGVMQADTADDQGVWWVSSVPEPSTWALWGAGLLGLLGHRRRRHGRG